MRKKLPGILSKEEVTGVGAVAFKLLAHPRPVLTEEDTVVLADFLNSIGSVIGGGF